MSYKIVLNCFSARWQAMTFDCYIEIETADWTTIRALSTKGIVVLSL